MSTSQFKEYVKIVKETSAYRTVIDGAKQVITNAYDQKPIEEILWEVQKITDVEVISKTAGTKAYDVMLEYMENIGKRDNVICNYWYRYLDEMCQGYKKWQLIILAGRPWVSKTATAINLADKITKQNKSVMFFSLEMTRYEITERLLSSWTGIWARELWWSVDRIDEIATKTVENLEQVEDYNLMIYDSTNKFEEITREIRKKAIRKEVDVVFIDYLTLMRVSWKFFSKNDEIGYMTWELKQIAIKHGIAIVLLAQLNRNSAKENKKPQMFDLRDSWNIEQDADNIYLLYRWNFEDEPLRKTTVEMIVAKQRTWWQGSIAFGIVPQTMTIHDIDQRILDEMMY